MEGRYFGRGILLLALEGWRDGPCTVCPPCFVQHGNVGFDVAVYEPAQHRSLSIGGVGNEPFWINSMQILDPIQLGTD